MTDDLDDNLVPVDDTPQTGEVREAVEQPTEDPEAETEPGTEPQGEENPA